MKHRLSILIVLALLSQVTTVSLAQTLPPAEPASGAGIQQPAPVVNPPGQTDLAPPLAEPPKAEVAPTAEALTPKKPAKPAVRKPPGTPFHGKLEAVDRAAMTLTIAGKTKSRTLHVTSHTRFTKEGKPATFTDGVVGEEVAGTTKKGPDGILEALTVRYGAKPTPNPVAKKSTKGTATRQKKSAAPPATDAAATPAPPATTPSAH